MGEGDYLMSIFTELECIKQKVYSSTFEGLYVATGSVGLDGVFLGVQKNLVFFDSYRIYIYVYIHTPAEYKSK